jgi:DsbC/DsbD-like thiol-disulfide interchange protein
MWIRSIFALLACCVTVSPAISAEKPYRVSLIGDAFDGTSWHTGVLVELDPGWKTYWRMPGEAGIPPDFTWTTSAPAKVTVSFPSPSRYADQSGETVGYEQAVLFPAVVTPQKAGPLDLKLDLFFAVCKDICIPASATASVTLGTMARDPAGSARVGQAAAMLPSPGEAITAASIVMEAGHPVLVLELKEKPDDIFVETPGPAYFRAPAFSADGRQARLAIDNVTDPAKLAGIALRLTYSVNSVGLEQTVKLP